jgi:hypothetical protein
MWISKKRYNQILEDKYNFFKRMMSLEAQDRKVRNNLSQALGWDLYCPAWEAIITRVEKAVKFEKDWIDWAKEAEKLEKEKELGNEVKINKCQKKS